MQEARQKRDTKRSPPLSAIFPLALHFLPARTARSELRVNSHRSAGRPVLALAQSGAADWPSGFGVTMR
ncbi:hypothetical protein NDU88_010409 [Pleurodeles waltl]|uniref:Uncharacterized protein n=1 Tax=Pleurodeles waltl TaxID=8319 RepID=A0AAV7RY65_PLEWA|nr:hypothetical protein NDU88_010409 [Pleurodeles waltl]